MTLWPSSTPCGLCGDTTATERRLVEWIEPVDGKTWSTISRCLDRPACRARVATVLEVPWPVNDRTPAPPTSLPPEVVAPIPVAELEEEEPAWLRT